MAEFNFVPAFMTDETYVKLSDKLMRFADCKPGLENQEDEETCSCQEEIVVPAATASRLRRKDSVRDIESVLQPIGSTCFTDACPKDRFFWENEYKTKGRRCLMNLPAHDYTCKAGTCVGCLAGVGPPVAASGSPMNVTDAPTATDRKTDGRKDSLCSCSVSPSDNHKNDCSHNNNILNPRKRFKLPQDRSAWSTKRRRRSSGESTWGVSGGNSLSPRLIRRR